MPAQSFDKIKVLTRTGIFVLLAIFLFPFCIFSIPAVSDKPDKGIILIVASYNPDTRRMASFISEFEHRITGEQVPFEILIEDMGCKGISEAPLWRARMDTILRRYQQENLKAVILLGQEAWASYLSSYEEIAEKNIPFFGCYASKNGVYLPADNIVMDAEWNPESVDMEQWANSLGHAGGCLNEYDIPKNLELIQNLYPNVEHIAFVSDNTYGGISLQSLVRREMKNHPDLDLIMIDARDGEDAAASQVANLPINSVLLIGTWRVGKDGQYLMYNSMDNLVTGNPMIPVFSLTGSGLGSVAIGGYNPKYESGAAQIAGQISNYYYKGKNNAIDFVPTQGEYRFDLRKLHEFGIAEYRLPTGSVVVDTMEAQLQKYKNYLSIGIIAFVILMLILSIIFYMYYRNKKLKNVLENREVELIKAKEKAEESDLLKSAFLANMSHEIRTPLNAIVGFSALLGDENISSEERTEYTAIVNTNSELMLTLISDILDISRLETGKITFNYSDEDIHTICQQVIFTTTHNRKPGVECVFLPSCESYIMKTDSQRLSQILINLMTNANKFTEQGTITLAFEVQESHNRVLFSVADTGCGIPKEMQSKVFNRFEKLNEFKQGTGLGLAICKQIALRFGGNIWVDPDYTQGSRFVFSHPIHQQEDNH